MYVMSRAIAQGSHAALLSAVGLALGDLLQVVATAVGLSALLASAPAIFLVLKFAGAAYLVVLGALTLVGKGARTASPIEGNLRPQQSAKRSLILPGISRIEPKDGPVLLGISAAVRRPERGFDKCPNPDVWNRVCCVGILYEFAVWLPRGEIG